MTEMLIERLLEIDDVGERVRLRVATSEGERTIAVAAGMLVPLITGLSSSSKALAHATGGGAVPTFRLVDAEARTSPDDQDARLSLSFAQRLTMHLRVPIPVLEKLIARSLAAHRDLTRKTTKKPRRPS